MVLGPWGWIASLPRPTSRRRGAHPAACVPYSRGGRPATSPASRNSPNPFRSFESSEPPAIGATTAVGSRQPSCSAISYAVFCLQKKNDAEPGRPRLAAHGEQLLPQLDARGDRARVSLEPV